MCFHVHVDLYEIIFRKCYELTGMNLIQASKVIIVCLQIKNFLQETVGWNVFQNSILIFTPAPVFLFDIYETILTSYYNSNLKNISWKRRWLYTYWQCSFKKCLPQFKRKANICMRPFFAPTTNKSLTRHFPMS